MKRTPVVTVSQSAIISAGLASVLRGLLDGNLSITETTPATCEKAITERRPDIIIAETSCIDKVTAETFRSQGIRIVGLITSAVPQETIKRFDDTVSIYDPRELISKVITRNLPSDTPDDKFKELSPREKDVIVGVVKGLSNKEIADLLNVSINTIMTHRRNIASKLQIHSPAGLTIYAIVSNLVNLDDIKTNF